MEGSSTGDGSEFPVAPCVTISSTSSTSNDSIIPSMGVSTSVNAKSVSISTSTSTSTSPGTSHGCIPGSGLQQHEGGSHRLMQTIPSTSASSTSSSSLTSSTIPHPQKPVVPVETSVANIAPAKSNIFVKGVFPSSLRARFDVNILDTARFYKTQDTKEMYGYFTKNVHGLKYPKIIHNHQPYEGWSREVIVDDEGNSKVHFIPPTAGTSIKTASGSGDGSVAETPSTASYLDVIRNRDELYSYINMTHQTKIFPTLLASSFEFDDLFCICHRPDEGDYFNCDYGLSGCGSWFHSDCIGVSKGALSRLVPGKDTPLICPSCTAYLETNLKEDEKFSVDVETGQDRLIFRLRLGGYYYVTNGPLINYMKTDLSTLGIIVNMIPKSGGKDVPYYRNIGGMEFVQSRNPPKYWGLSKLRAPVTVVNSRTKNTNPQSKTTNNKISSEDHKTLGPRWVANCSNCHAEGPYEKPSVPVSARDDGKGELIENFELHLIPREGSSTAVVSDFCGEFKLNPRLKPSNYVNHATKFNSSSVGSSVTSSSVSGNHVGRITKKVSRKASVAQDSERNHPQSSQIPSTKQPTIVQGRTSPLSSILSQYVPFDSSSVSRNLRPSFVQKCKIQHHVLQVQKYNEDRCSRQKLIFAEASCSINATDMRALNNSHERIQSLMGVGGSHLRLESTNRGGVGGAQWTLPSSTLTLLGLERPDQSTSTKETFGTSDSRGAISIADVQHNVNNNDSAAGMSSTIPDEISNQLPKRAFSSSDPNVSKYSSTDPLPETTNIVLPSLPKAPSISTLTPTPANMTIYPKVASDSATIISAAKDGGSGSARNAIDLQNPRQTLLVGSKQISENGIQETQPTIVPERTTTIEKIIPSDNIKLIQEVLPKGSCADANINVEVECDEVRTTQSKEIILGDNEGGVAEGNTQPNTNCEHSGDKMNDEKYEYVAEPALDSDVNSFKGDNSRQDVVVNMKLEESKVDNDDVKLDTTSQSVFIQDSILVQRESDGDESDESQSEKILPGQIFEDPGFLKRKRKAMSASRPYDLVLKKRLLDCEASRISSCFQNAGKNDASAFLFLHLPLEDGGLKTTGLNVSSGAPTSIQSFLEENDLCSYCIEPIVDSDDLTSMQIGAVRYNFHKVCTSFLATNVLRNFVEARNYGQYLSIAEVYQYSSREDSVACGLCDKGGGVLQSISLVGKGLNKNVPLSGSSSELKAIDDDQINILAHPICVASLIESKQLESKNIPNVHGMPNEPSKSDICTFDRNFNGGYCTICGSHRGLAYTCGSSCCAVQAHYMCAKRENWYLNSAEVGGDDKNSTDDNVSPCTGIIFMCPLHSE